LFKEIRLCPCVTPPKKEVLLQKLKSYLSKNKLNAGQDHNHTPDKQWLINVLSTITPKDEIFDKGYFAPTKTRTSREYKALNIPPMFVHGLPLAKKGRKRRSLRFVAEGKVSAKLMRMKELKDNLEKQIECEKVEMENRKFKRQKIN